MATVTKTAATTVACPGVLLRNINNDTGIAPVCQDVRVDDGTDITFTFAVALSPAEDAQLDTLITNLVCETSLVSATVDELAGAIFPFTFSYADDVYNKWLSYTGEENLPSDETFAIVPFDCKLVGIVFSNEEDDADTDVTVKSAAYGATTNESTKILWQLRSVRTARKTNFANEILFTAGDKIGIYCKGVSSSVPDKVVVVLYMQITNINSEEQTENFSGKF